MGRGIFIHDAAVGIDRREVAQSADLSKGRRRIEQWHDAHSRLGQGDLSYGHGHRAHNLKAWLWFVFFTKRHTGKRCP